MNTKEWNITQDGESHNIKVSYTLFLGKMSVTINDSEYTLPNRFLMGLFGRKENFVLGERLATLRVKPFGEIELITAKGKF